MPNDFWITRFIKQCIIGSSKPFSSGYTECPIMKLITYNVIACTDTQLLVTLLYELSTELHRLHTKEPSTWFHQITSSLLNQTWWYSHIGQVEIYLSVSVANGRCHHIDLYNWWDHWIIVHVNMFDSYAIPRASWIKKSKVSLVFHYCLANVIYHFFRHAQ